jgi:serine/threonine protein kinase
MGLAAGTILGQYEIRSPLGAGGMGEVYRAHDTRLHREVAIKVLPESLTSDPERLRRFEQEARATAALNHPNILAVYQMATDNISYLVEELLDGETLRDRLRHGPISLRKAIDYAVQIAHGLAAAHDKGIVHRDLKPENLFITKDGRVKILDFGLAKLGAAKDASGQAATLTQQTNPGTVMGTVGYMSPEQVRGKEADDRSDIFALGTILYEMVTGKQTFRKPTSAETMTAILNEEPRSISQIAPATPPGLQRVVHRCLEKDPEQRFHSAHDLAFALEALTDSVITTPSGSHAATRAGWSRRRIATAAVGIGISLGSVLFADWWLRPQPVPKVSNYVQLTHDGQPKELVGTEGSRLYFYLTSHDYQGIAEMYISGGEAKRVPILPSTNYFPISLSPDGSRVLAVEPAGGTGVGPLWSFPLLGGSPRRLENLVAADGAWSPDGKWLAYVNGSDIFVANADGAESRKVASVNKSSYVGEPVWSPDARRLRFDVGEQGVGNPVLWEVALDGANLHRLFPGWTSPPDYECCGKWTADGKYFIFRSRRQIWILQEKGGFLHSQPKPVQLTSSPLSLGAPTPSTDGKKIFVVGRIFRGESIRYDQKSGRFAPFLGGASAEYFAFSKDGQWVTYVSYPDGVLWRSRVDGSDRLQLTYPPANIFPPFYALMPRWSPDGKNIAFFASPTGKPAKIYEVSSEGGSPRLLMPDDPGDQRDPNWSPDGNKIVFGGNATPTSELHILDLTTHQVSTLPNSQGLFAPRWSPDGRYIPALSADNTRLVAFDLQTQKWKELVKGQLGWLNWSKDGQSLLLLDLTGTGAVIEVRLSDGKTERLLSLKDFVGAGYFNLSLSLASDDSPLLLKETGSQDVYALDWEEP